MAEKKKVARKSVRMDAVDADIVRAIHAKHHPTFRGSFGTRSIRRKSIKKWNKWRKPRGIDATLRLEKREDGSKPKPGYRTPNAIRHRHASGLEEMRIENLSQLNGQLKGKAVKIASTVGERKRKLLIAKADQLQLTILNRGMSA